MQKRHKVFLHIFVAIGILLIIFILWQLSIAIPTSADWWPELAVLSTAEFDNNLVTVKNVRNFRYEGENVYPDYYDETYDLNKLVRVWYISEPFKNFDIAAHTFLSFEFSDKKFLSVTIEARKKNGQDYSLLRGMLRTYPLMYIAADERDSVLVRTNTRKSDVYMYPVKLSSIEKGRELMVDVLERMNSLATNPKWYKTFSANCTSSIAYHVNRISPGRLPYFPWQVWITGYADRLALERGLLDTNLTLEEAREKYYITKKSRQIGDVENFSELIRQFD